MSNATSSLSEVSFPEQGGMAACPACAVAPAIGQGEDAHGDLLVSVPSMHCAVCIATIEDTLMALPNVQDVNVNLSLKRVAVTGSPYLSMGDVLTAIRGAGYEAFELDQTLLQSKSDDTERQLLLRLGVAGFAMMNVMLLSVSVWSGASDSTRDLLHWISAVIAFPTVFYAAQPFFRSGWRALRVGKLNMDVPISLAIILALLMSLYETFVSGKHAYFDAALSLTFFLLIGRYLDYRTRSIARSAAEEIAALDSAKAIRIGDEDQLINVREIEIGDKLRVLPGARVPTDGLVLVGTSEVDTSFLSGETMPELVETGQDVRAGVKNLTGMLIVQATTLHQDSSLQKIARLVAIAETSRNKYSSLADRAARIYAPAVHLLAIFAFIGWMMIGGDWRFAMNVAIATLIITCPCALGLAVPAVNTAASGRLFQNSVLLKSETALERLAEVDYVMFDKTGTLTNGTPELVEIEGAEAHLDVALALAQGSSHPLAQAIVRALRAKGIVPAEISDLREIAGYGVEGRAGDVRVRLGRHEWLGAMQNDARTSSAFAFGEEITNFFFVDQARPEAAQLICDLKALGLPIRLISGDREEPVRALAEALGIEDYQAAMLPEDKLAAIEDLQKQGRKVLMVGDGLNDTAALAAAYVSISPASAIDASRTASDIVILGDHIGAIATSFTIARAARKRILENFWQAALYNAVAIPIALLGLVTPLIAALAMSASSITVVLNANRIRWMK